MGVDAELADSVTGEIGECMPLEPAVISRDPVLIERLVTSLVDNAVRYNIGAGDIWISTHTEAGISRLTVANTGPAISSQDAGRDLPAVSEVRRPHIP